MRVALVHDYLNQYGGAERVLEAFCELFPHAPIYTLFYDAAATNGAFEGRDIRTSFLQNIPFVRTHHRYFPMLMPLAIEQFDFSGFDLVLSSSASYAKGVITKPGTLHICYCHTPTRYAWADSHISTEYASYPRIVKNMVPMVLPYVRIWDRQASARPDIFLANSRFVQRRIAKYYRREAEVVYPPLDLTRFSIDDSNDPGLTRLESRCDKHRDGRKSAPGSHCGVNFLIEESEASREIYCCRNDGTFIPNDADRQTRKSDDYFLLVGRLVPYKRFDIAVRACTALGINLKVVGEGPHTPYLKKIAGPTIEFLGYVRDEELSLLYAGARALLFPQEEDFGISALESMAAGRPVIAYRGGGALEYVEEGTNGIFFDEQTSESLVPILKNFDERRFVQHDIRASVEQFDKKYFLQKISEIINKQ